MIELIDDWIIDRVAQPIVDASWSRLGVSRATLCKMMIVVYGSAAFSHGYWVIGTIAPLSMFVQIHTNLSRRDYPFVVMRTLEIFVTVPLILFMIEFPDFKVVLIWAALVLFDYLSATRDPPPRKRKDWKAVLGKFVAQWTWVPQPVRVSK
jgi:hypothetical protein